MEDRVKEHFEEEATQYDDIIVKLIPYYKEMVYAITASIPFTEDTQISVIDLGCGTGTISQAVQKKYTKAKFTLVDVAENMLRIAESKLIGNQRYTHADFNSFEFDQQYDVIVSSLALHHLETNTDKQLFYNKIYRALKTGGIFINADVVEAKSQTLQTTFIEEWVKYMNRSVDMSEIEEKWLPNYYAEDKPIPMMDHLDMLKNSGFKNIDIIWKYYGFSVYKGEK